MRVLDMKYAQQKRTVRTVAKKALSVTNEVQYKKLEKKLARIGFFRKQYDSDGSKISETVHGAVFFSEAKNVSGANLVVMVTKYNNGGTVVRVTGYDAENDNIVDTPDDYVYHNLNSAEEIAAVSAQALRSFLPNESFAYNEQGGDSKSVRIHERNALNGST